MARKTIRALLEEQEPLVIPSAHDAMCARMIEWAGLKCYLVGGNILGCTQHAIPDYGLQSFGEFCTSIRSIMEGSSLPALIDGENGFGDVKNVTRMIRSYEAMGTAGLALEDLVLPVNTQRGPEVDALEVISAKLEAALAARQSADFFIVGRTDAYMKHGLDEALRRAVRYAEIGVDAVLVTGLSTIEEMQRLREAVSLPLLAVVIESGPWPKLSPAAFHAMGYQMVFYPATLMMHAATAIRDALDAIKAGRTDAPAGQLDYPALSEILGFGDWADLDRRFN